MANRKDQRGCPQIDGLGSASGPGEQDERRAQGGGARKMIFRKPKARESHAFSDDGLLGNLSEGVGSVEVPGGYCDFQRFSVARAALVFRCQGYLGALVKTTTACGRIRDPESGADYEPEHPRLSGRKPNSSAF